MTATELFEKDYRAWVSCTGGATKYEWASSKIFGFSTYDGELDEIMVKKIIEVCKIMLDGKTYEYIEDKNNYLTYIVVCQLLEHFNWINWGTSIRGAWFDSDNARPILGFYGEYTVKFNISNLRSLIEFIEKEDT